MTDPHQLRVTHANGSYPVYIGPGALNHSDLPGMAEGRPLLIVTDSHLANTPWLDDVRAALPAAGVLILPTGEESKTLANVEKIWNSLVERACGRDALLIALGGGVIGDMTGFAAACWMRGVEFVQIPTSLLAQVDASVGGKTGVDLAVGKNLIGAFHQPRAVFIDTRTLSTLPEREYKAGLAEIAKAALIADLSLFEWLEENMTGLNLRSETALLHAIRRSCEIKATIVAADEREHGPRAWLNLGHTFGHALEQITGYTRYLHGEAVAIGLVMALMLSERVTGLDPALRPRLISLLQAFSLPTSLPADIAPDLLLDAMHLDKKHVMAGWRLVLLRAPGDPVLQTFAGTEASHDLRAILGES